MNREISKDRLEKLDLSGFEPGDMILFCHDCDFQTYTVTAMKE